MVHWHGREKKNALAGQLRNQLPDCPQKEASIKGGDEGGARVGWGYVEIQFNSLGSSSRSEISHEQFVPIFFPKKISYRYAQ